MNADDAGGGGLAELSGAGANKKDKQDTSQMHGTTRCSMALGYGRKSSTPAECGTLR